MVLLHINNLGWPKIEEMETKLEITSYISYLSTCLLCLCTKTTHSHSNILENYKMFKVWCSYIWWTLWSQVHFALSLTVSEMRIFFENKCKKDNFGIFPIFFKFFFFYENIMKLGWVEIKEMETKLEITSYISFLLTCLLCLCTKTTHSHSNILENYKMFKVWCSYI